MTTSLRLLLWNFFLAARTVAITERPRLGYTTPSLVVPSRPSAIRGNLPKGFLRRVSSSCFGHHPFSHCAVSPRPSDVFSAPQGFYKRSSRPTPFDLHIRNPPFNGYLLGHRQARCLPIKGVDISPTLTRCVHNPQGFPVLRFDRSIFDHLLPYSSIYSLALHHWRIDVLLAHKRRPGSSSLSPPPPSAAVVQGSTTMSFCLPTVRIIVTSNAERYQVVEITGATNGSSIRERILSKLCIPDDRYSRFRVYQAQVGTYAIGSALSDAMLFEICLQQGDPSGSLTFFVSTAPDRPPKTMEPDYSDTYLYSQS
ncbi:hypothetical protein EDD85DRAFT_857296 [Armillaria nabsnona]|nr:hypothetical protein EDD85DRAFT_857296 [Armillaria nabsnona]